MSVATFTVSSPLGQFADIELSGRQLPVRVDGRPTYGEPTRFEWSGMGTAEIETALRAVAIPSNALVNGAPDIAMNGVSFAQTLSTGRLVNLEYSYYNGPDVDLGGIIVVLSAVVGPNSPGVHSLQVVFYPMLPCSRLYYADGDYDVLPPCGGGIGIM